MGRPPRDHDHDHGPKSARKELIVLFLDPVRPIKRLAQTEQTTQSSLDSTRESTRTLASSGLWHSSFSRPCAWLSAPVFLVISFQIAPDISSSILPTPLRSRLVDWRTSCPTLVQSAWRRPRHSRPLMTCPPLSYPPLMPSNPRIVRWDRVRAIISSGALRCELKDSRAGP